MFRNPRENASLTAEASVRPSTGRAPTPPALSSSTSSHDQAIAGKPSMAMSNSHTPLATKPNTHMNVGLVGKGSPFSTKRSKGKQNGSILSFFQKVATPPKRSDKHTQHAAEDPESLFFGNSESHSQEIIRQRSETPDDWSTSHQSPSKTLKGYGVDLPDDSRFNEDVRATKRRRTSPEVENGALVSLKSESQADKCEGGRPSATSTVKPSGPFVEDSESDDEVKSVVPSTRSNQKTETGNDEDTAGLADDGSARGIAEAIPTLIKEESSNVFDDDGFRDLENFEDDEYVDGEEFVERKWMEEQRRLEMAENGFDEDDVDGFESFTNSTIERRSPEDTAPCPICSASLKGFADDIAQLHVNNCLDGKPTALPALKPEAVETDVKPQLPLTPHRFQRPAKPAKPGQANPFAAGPSKAPSSSAFSKLMSSHAEDAAWASAAAAENAARGKPAFERTCPFYKILPGFSICVDAFRYGAVEGCQAYFLSHFHSDHYIGLTSTWQHGPIYCSRVTANLVRQQLRVDPKYVVDMEFEQKIDVPGTNGVQVTMISANHCPGSALFLYEKTIGKGKNPKVQRVLHCGDFRACPAHVRHPLLRPELVDAVTGKQAGQQRIDVCYLDTTYLNPRYAFPSQEKVIQSCADLCVSLRKEQADETDAWESMKRENGMGSFLQKDPSRDQDASAAKAASSFLTASNTSPAVAAPSRGRLLVVVGTYSIGKERICVGIARALNSLIFAPQGKRRICACLEDPELDSLLTSDPRAAQVHMTPLFEIRAETLQSYLDAYRPHFSRVVGFRPSGWNYRPPTARFVESPAVRTVLTSPSWKSGYSVRDLTPQRGSTRDALCYGVPYSEHSSFRELTIFCCALRIDKVIPTVNVGSAKSREKMKVWIDRWAMERRKNGLFRLDDGQDDW
ncbi:MAG: hypothetical protein M1825_006128 [Sarcosagium campestre]|nr:MAG: hypothetical protein M1825_006128 [Sarcosagium campestre]